MMLKKRQSLISFVLIFIVFVAFFVKEGFSKTDSSDEISDRFLFVQKRFDQEKSLRRALIVPISFFSGLSSSQEWLVKNVMIFDSISKVLEEYSIEAIDFETIWREYEKRRLISRKFKLYLKKNRLSKRELNDFLYQLKTIDSRVDWKTILDIAKKYDADLIIRPQVIFLDRKAEKALSPLRAGLVTSAIRSTRRLLFGRSESEKIQLIESMSIGAALGAYIGSNAKDPFEPPEYEYEISDQAHPIYSELNKVRVSGNEDYEALNALTYAAAGAAVAYLAENSGLSNSVILNERLYVYQKENGLIYANSIFLKENEKIFSDSDDFISLERRAIEKANSYLVRDFLESVKALSNHVEVSEEKPSKPLTKTQMKKTVRRKTCADVEMLFSTKKCR